MWANTCLAQRNPCRNGDNNNLPTLCNKYAGDHLALARHEFKVFKGGWWMLIGQLAASSIWSLSYCNICRVANIFLEPRISMTPRREMDYWEFLTQAELNSSGARRLRRKKEVIASIHSKCFEDIAVVFLVWNYQESQWREAVLLDPLNCAEAGDMLLARGIA